ncbi:MAG: ATP-binding protein [Spirochaetota bacterium]
MRRGAIISTSCASGPAFEGAGLKHGMRAVSGAIEKVKATGSGMEFLTIDDARPVGFCGSGIVDAIAILNQTGIINKHGRLVNTPGIHRVSETPEYVLISGKESGTGRDITLTQKDVSEIQLAKAAIRTGMETLLKTAGITWEEVEEVIIAGAFGSHIEPASAVAIGMFPDLPLIRFRQVGNAAGTGARLALLSRSKRTKAKEIAEKIQYLELMVQPGFKSSLAHNMYFPR